jgi:hypothetical protein
MEKINLNNDQDFNLIQLFNDMTISEAEIIEIANKSNNLSDFCKLMYNIINQRYGQRCYQLTLNTLPVIY